MRVRERASSCRKSPHLKRNFSEKRLHLRLNRLGAKTVPRREKANRFFNNFSITLFSAHQQQKEDRPIQSSMLPSPNSSNAPSDHKNPAKGVRSKNPFSKQEPNYNLREATLRKPKSQNRAFSFCHSPKDPHRGKRPP